MGKGKAIAGFVLGLTSLVVSFVFGPLLCMVMAVVGLCLSSEAGKQLRAEENMSGRNFATAGLALSMISVALNGITLIACGIVVAVAGVRLGGLREVLEELMELFS